jgi:uncharacterized protein involved in cysteine biosynthesis
MSSPRPKGAGGRFFWAAGFVGRGIATGLGNGKLLPWVLMPAALTTLVTFFLAGWAWRAANHYIDEKLAGHNAFVAALLWVVVVLFVASIGYVAFLVTSMLATAPFAGQISERTEKVVTGAVIAPKGFSTILSETIRDIGHTLLVLALYLTITVVVIGLQWVLSPLAPFIWVLNVFITGWFLTFDAFDLPLARRQKTFGQKWSYLSKHKAEAYGFGVLYALLLAVPVLGLFMPAFAAVGGTLLYLEIEKSDSLAAAQKAEEKSA